MSLRSIRNLAAAALLAAVSGTASAGTAPFVMISGYDHPGLDISVTVQQSTTPGFIYDFIVTNLSSTGTVTGVYFETGWNAMIWGAGLSTGPAVLDPASLSPSIDGWEGSKVSHTVGKDHKRYWVGRYYRDVYTDRIDDGIEPGQTQTFSFNTNPEKISLEDIEDKIGQDRFGIGIRVHATDGSGQIGWGLADGINEPDAIQGPGNEPKPTGVPSPSAAFAGLIMMGLASARRRRA